MEHRRLIILYSMTKELVTTFHLLLVSLVYLSLQVHCNLELHTISRFKPGISLGLVHFLT